MAAPSDGPAVGALERASRWFEPERSAAEQRDSEDHGEAEQGEADATPGRVLVGFRKEVGRTHEQEEPGVEGKEIAKGGIRDVEQGSDGHADEGCDGVGDEPSNRL